MESYVRNWLTRASTTNVDNLRLKCQCKLLKQISRTHKGISNTILVQMKKLLMTKLKVTNTRVNTIQMKKKFQKITLMIWMKTQMKISTRVNLKIHINNHKQVSLFFLLTFSRHAKSKLRFWCLYRWKYEWESVILSRLCT